MLWLSQSVAVTLKIGPFLDDTDGKTAETALTIAQADVRLSKNGGDMAQKGNATSCTHDEIGVYDCPLSTTDTSTLGRLQLFVHQSGALPVWHEFMVVKPNTYDGLITQTDTLFVHTTEITSGLITNLILAANCIGSSQIGSNAITASEIASDAIGASELAADAVAEIADQVWDEILSGHLGVGSTGEALDAAGGGVTAAAIADAVWDEAAAGHVDAGKAGQQLWTDVDAILADTGTDGVVLADGAVAAAKIATGAITSAKIAANAITNSQLANDCIGAQEIADDAINAGAFAASASAEIADAVWDELATGHTDAGKAGQQLWTDLDAVLADTNELQVDDVPGLIAALNDLTAAQVNAEVDTALGDYDAPTKAELDSGLAALNDLTAAQVNAEVDTALGDYDAPTKAELDSGLAGLNDPTVSAIADQVWDEAIADHVGAGSTGEALNSAGGGSSPATIADAVWDEGLADHVAAGSTGSALTTILGAAPSGGVLGGGTVTLGDLVKEVALRLGSYRRLTATSGGLSSVFDTVGLIEPDEAFVNLYAYILEDAGGGGAAPEGEERLITAYTRSNAMLTVAPAFSSEVAVDDIVEILPERRDRLTTAINAAIGAAGERWAVVSRDTSTLTVAASTYEYELASSFSSLSRLLSIWTRGEATEAWREIPSSNYHLTGTPGAEVLVFDTLAGLDAGDVLMLQYRQLPAKLTADTDTLGLGAVAERELVRFVVEYALGWLHQAAAATTPQDFREHWSLSKRHYDEAEKVRTGGGGRRRGGRVRYTRGSKARG